MNLIQSHLEPVFVEPRRFEIVGAPAMAKAGKLLAKTLRGTPLSSPIAQFATRSEKIGNLLGLFVPFTTMTKGPFSCANTRAAFERLSDEDKKKLDWAPESL